MLYGAVLSVLAAVLLVAVAGRDRRPTVLIKGGCHRVPAANLLETDPALDRSHRRVLPRPALPAVPGQLAGCRRRRVHPRRCRDRRSLVVCAKDPARRVGLLALWAALGAFLIDIDTC